MSKRNDYPQDVIQFLQQLPHDEPIWVSIVTVKDVRSILEDSGVTFADYSSMDEIPVSLFAEAMIRQDKAGYFDDSPPVQQIADEVFHMIESGENQRGTK